MDTIETDWGDAIQDECNDDLCFSRNPLLRDREAILLSKAITHSVYDETTDLRLCWSIEHGSSSHLMGWCCNNWAEHLFNPQYPLILCTTSWASSDSIFNYCTRSLHRTHEWLIHHDHSEYSSPHSKSHVCNEDLLAVVTGPQNRGRNIRLYTASLHVDVEAHAEVVMSPMTSYVHPCHFSLTVYFPVASNGS